MFQKRRNTSYTVGTEAPNTTQAYSNNSEPILVNWLKGQLIIAFRYVRISLTLFFCFDVFNSDELPSNHLNQTDGQKSANESTNSRTHTESSLKFLDVTNFAMFIVLNNVPLCQLFLSNEVCKRSHGLRDFALLRLKITLILVPSEDFLEILRCFSVFQKRQRSLWYLQQSKK